MDAVKHIFLDETDSTNRYLRDYDGEEGELMTIVAADYQQAGRGQGKNSWESEKGCNLLFSLKTRPRHLPVQRQFVMLEAGALAVDDALRDWLNDNGGDGARLTIKWPNDIYWGDRKLSGTLSECHVKGGEVGHCIFGVGINVNQRTFLSDAPNPVSVAQIIGRDSDRLALLNSVINNYSFYLAMVDTGRLDDIHTDYVSRLYNSHGYRRYEDANGPFTAAFVDVEPTGILVLRDQDRHLRRYAFKEVRYVI